MAMDKEQLLGYFTTHYFSRREVLFRLPLNVSIGSFWPELLNRRKANADILPLYDGSGKPYWFVLTDKMIEASERLCAEAMNCDLQLDPYKPVQSADMNDEIFFTSFVEGAQISRKDAMNFLSGNAEPDNIGEQMLANNKKALTAVLSSLYMPIDEQYMKGLAYMLTEEMEGCSDGYRQEDYHEISAMNGEPYEVPSAAVLPERMNDLYTFLSSPDIHPLIKTAVGQAYLLVTRPFSEGNERLSRIISRAILLRSGYGFFRDISVSMAYARENYGYYKSMCEIIRSENGGDLTYFMEFYLTTLVRAIEQKRERERKKEEERIRREQENIRREQELARQPLARPEPPVEKAETNEQPPVVVAEKIENNETVSVKESKDTSSADGALIPLPTESPPGIEEIIRKMESVYYQSTKDAAARVRKAISDGMLSFTNTQWSEHFGIPIEKTKTEMAMLQRYKLVSWKRTQNGAALYTFKTKPEPELRQNETGGSDIEDVLKAITAQSSSEKEKTAVQVLREMLNQGIESFGSRRWQKMSGVIPYTADSALNFAADRGLVTAKGEGVGRVYTVCKTVQSGMRSFGLSETQRDFLGKLYSEYKGEPFTAKDAIRLTGHGRSFVATQAQHFSNRMLIENISERGNVNLYRIMVTPESHPECFPVQTSKSYPIAGTYIPSGTPMAAAGR